jgi:hypothetical protein
MVEQVVAAQVALLARISAMENPKVFMLADAHSPRLKLNSSRSVM